MALTIKKTFIALLCLSLLLSSLTAVMGRYDFDGGEVYFSVAFASDCSIKEYKKQSLEPRTGCNDARICGGDNTAATNRDTDSALPGEVCGDGANLPCGSFLFHAVGNFGGTQRKLFYLRI